MGRLVARRRRASRSSGTPAERTASSSRSENRSTRPAASSATRASRREGTSWRFSTIPQQGRRRRLGRRRGLGREEEDASRPGGRSETGTRLGPARRGGLVHRDADRGARALQAVDLSRPGAASRAGDRTPDAPGRRPRRPVLLTHETIATGYPRARSRAKRRSGIFRGSTGPSCAISPPTGRRSSSTRAARAPGRTTQVFLRKTDGSPAVRLGEGAAMALSPDGKWVALDPARLACAARAAPDGIGRVAPDHERCRSTTSAPRSSRTGRGSSSRGTSRGAACASTCRTFRAASRAPSARKGSRSSPIAISPDGKRFAAIGPDGETWLYPVDRGEPERAPGVQAGESARSAGAATAVRSMSVTVARVPARIFRVDLPTGRRELWKEFAPADPSGSRRDLRSPRRSRSRRLCVHLCARILSDLYVASGIR